MAKLASQLYNSSTLLMEPTMKKFVPIFLAIIVFFTLGFPASVRADELIAIPEAQVDEMGQLPIGTMVVLGIIVILVIVGVFILVRILKSSE